MAGALGAARFWWSCRMQERRWDVLCRSASCSLSIDNSGSQIKDTGAPAFARSWAGAGRHPVNARLVAGAEMAFATTGVETTRQPSGSRSDYRLRQNGAQTTKASSDAALRRSRDAFVGVEGDRLWSTHGPV